MFDNPRLIIETSKAEPGTVGWKSPSNLAIVKYWGKHGDQLPNNPSVSFTLHESVTETRIQYAPKKGIDSGLSLDFYFEGQKNTQFEDRLKGFLSRLFPVFPFLKQLELRIDSRNSFPHSSGIASSASSMSALALGLCSMESRFFDTLEPDAFYQKASYVARLGSGSACRSLYPSLVWWGAFSALENAHDEYAIPFEENSHPVFHNFRDSICIVSRKEKSVSSSAGHKLMDQNPFAPPRYTLANKHLLRLITALKSGDLEDFGKITETEALNLHALMMSSNPPYLLVEPATVEIIQRLWAFRKDTGHPVYFSLDAGPNVHILYPKEIEDPVRAFIDTEITPQCVDGRVIFDSCGAGPEPLKAMENEA